MVGVVAVVAVETVVGVGVVVEDLSGDLDPLLVAEAWTRVVEVWDEIGRLAKHMARRDSRIDAEDLRSMIATDCVERFELYDPARGEFRSWVFSRAMLNRLRLLRLATRHEPYGRLELGRPRNADSEAGGQEDRLLLEPAVGVGARGSPARCEALADLQGIYDRTDPAGRDAIMVRLHGLDPKVAGLSRTGLSSRVIRIRESVAEERG